ncbi:MAG TPA: nuclear transport factor 2 family protein [Lacunisphaera sp.]|nr:nuclear transport factor 2 family protein [Lacunisphaera sp.]
MTNIEIVRAVYASVRESDYDAFRRLCAPDVIWTQNKGFPQGGVRVGAEAVIDGVFRRFAREWTSWRYELEQVLESGNQVVALGAYHGVHAQTNKRMKADAAHVFRLADGKVVAFRQFADTKAVCDAMQ